MKRTITPGAAALAIGAAAVVCLFIMWKLWLAGPPVAEPRGRPTDADLAAGSVSQ